MIQPFFHPSARNARRLLLGAAVFIGACAQPRGSTDGPGRAEDRANLPLEKIAALPPLPPIAGPASAPAESDLSAMRHLATARARFADELWTEAIEEAERAIRVAPELAEAHLLAGRAALQQGNAASAVLHADEAQRLAPRDARVHQLRGSIAWSQKEFDKAIESFRLALQCLVDSSGGGSPAPELVLSRLFLGLSLAQQGYLRAAREQLEAYVAAAAHPSDAMRADPELKAAMALQADKVQARLADIYEHFGDAARAADALSQAVRANGEDIGLKRRWAVALARLGKADAALEIARQVAAASDDEAAIKLMDEVCRLLHKPQQGMAELQRLAGEPGRAGLAARLAERQLAAGKSGEAASLLEHAAKSNPTSAAVRFQLAELCARAGRWADYTRALQEALAVDEREYPRAVASLHEIGRDPAAGKAVRAAIAEQSKGASREPRAVLIEAMLLDAAGRAQEATDALAGCAGRFGKSPESGHVEGLGAVCAVLAERQLKAKRWPDAIEACRTAIAHGYSDSALQQALGDGLDAEDDAAGAEAAYREAGRGPGRRAAALLRLAQLQERRRDLRRAEQTYRQIIEEIDPRNAAAHEGLLRNYLTTGQGDRAAAEIREIKRLKLSGAEARRCAALYELAARPGDGPQRLKRYRGVLDEILKQQPNDIASRMDLAYSLTSAGDYEAALPEIDRVLAWEPDHVAARELKVEALARLLRQDEAHRLLVSMIVERPRLSRWRELLMVQLALDRVDDVTVIEELNYLIGRDDLAARRPTYQAQLIGVLVAAGRHDEAIPQARGLYEADPKNEARRGIYATTLERAGRNDQALGLAEELLRADPTRFEARAFYVQRLLTARRFPQATRMVLAWMEDEPENDELAMLLVQTLFAARDYGQTIALLTNMAVDPSNQRASLVLLESYERMGRWDEAAELIEAMSRGQPEEIAEPRRFDLYLQAGRLADAERLLNKQLEPLLERQRAGEPFDAQKAASRLRSLSVIYTRLGQEGRGEAMLEQALALTPNDPGVNNDLGYGWADAGKNLDKAEKMLRRAVAAEPRQEAYLDSLGWLLYKRGRWSEAAEWMRRAVRWADPADPVILDHAGDVQYRLGHEPDAVALWKRSLEALRSADRRPFDPQRDAEVLKSLNDKVAASAAGKTIHVAPAAIPGGAAAATRSAARE